MCSTPVTFGGGTAIEKFSAALPSGSGWKMPLSSQRAMMRDSTSLGSKRVRDSSSEAATARVFFRSTSPDHDLLVHGHRMQVAEEPVGARLVEALGRDLPVLVR